VQPIDFGNLTLDGRSRNHNPVTPHIYGEVNIKSYSAMSTATEPARPRCFPPGDVMHESA